MITWLRYEEKPTLDNLNKALLPHGLIAKSFENGNEYEFAICPPETTNEQIIDTIIENFDHGDEPVEELRKDLESYIKTQ